MWSQRWSKFFWTSYAYASDEIKLVKNDNKVWVTAAELTDNCRALIWVVWIVAVWYLSMRSLYGTESSHHPCKNQPRCCSYEESWWYFRYWSTLTSTTDCCTMNTYKNRSKEWKLYKYLYKKTDEFRDNVSFFPLSEEALKLQQNQQTLNYYALIVRATSKFICSTKRKAR